jgi:mRNA-degrading endonuclease RelE of RelBE toxin-antitoxin system
LTKVRHWRILIIKGEGVPVSLVIIETSVFTRQVQNLLSDDEYRTLQAVLVIRPNAGPLIAGGGGLRKLRWSALGKGKRGGVRVMYYRAVAQKQLLLLMIYSKSERDDLSPAQVRVLRAMVEEEYH